MQQHSYSVEVDGTPEEVWSLFWYRGPRPPGPDGVAAPFGESDPAAIVRDLPGSALLLPHRTGTDGFFIAALRRTT